MALQNAMLFIDDGEELDLTADAFRRTQEQVAARIEPVVKSLHDAVLKFVVHVNQHIAAGHQIEF